MGGRPRTLVAGRRSGRTVRSAGPAVLASLIVLSGCGPGARGSQATGPSAPATSASSVASTSTTTSTARPGSAIPAVDVLSLQMFTTSAGIAVAFIPSPSPHGYCCTGAPARHRDYLAATSDGGMSWRITGVLPVDVNPAQSYELQLAFGDPSEGYVQSFDPDATLFTDDAGLTWSSLHLPGQPTAISLDGQALWVVSNVCPTPTTPAALCPSRLLTYLLGHLTPAAELPIPNEGVVASPGISVSTRPATLLDRLAPSSAVVAEGSEGAPSSLLVTVDSGHHWSVLSDPCEGLSPVGLVAPAPTTWVLYCQLDAGMHQGATRLYTTGDQGAHWTLSAEGNVEGPTLGTIGDGMAGDLTVSGDGRVLWLLGSVDGVSSSDDGGVDWTSAPVQSDGYDTELAPAGPAGAWLPLPGVGLYHTTDGTNWSTLSAPGTGQVRPRRWVRVTEGRPGHVGTPCDRDPPRMRCRGRSSPWRRTPVGDATTRPWRANAGDARPGPCYRPVRSRCLHPGQQQGRRRPSSSSSWVRRMRRSRVTACLASSTQQMNSLRARGVMSFQAASAVGLAISALRRSAGSSCAPPHQALGGCPPGQGGGPGA